MDFFLTAKTVRLKSSHDKYLTADEDEESVIQDRNGSSRSSKWTVEFVVNSDNIFRLKSCYNKYLTASKQLFLLGMTGRKVTQSLPSRLDSSVEWEPVLDNGVVKLKTKYGKFLRANGGLPPWRNSVTHDIPHRTVTQEWISWEVHVLEILVTQSPAEKAPPPVVAEKEDSSISESTSPTKSKSASFPREESSDSFVGSIPKGNQGRLIYFHIADEYGEVDRGFEELCISFKGNEVHELTTRLEVELGFEGITVCARSPNGKLYPLHLQLPPNNTTRHVVVVPRPSSRVSQDLDESGVPFYARCSEIPSILIQ
ncbi:uncharacterized protein [Henckelia pumila]|uniref:uncharacterized protein n=1 Tax=Henckelia pumila TaxID=405737 RepID=UPI003C6EA18F